MLIIIAKSEIPMLERMTYVSAKPGPLHIAKPLCILRRISAGLVHSVIRLLAARIHLTSSRSTIKSRELLADIGKGDPDFMSYAPVFGKHATAGFCGCTLRSHHRTVNPYIVTKL